MICLKKEEEEIKSERKTWVVDLGSQYTQLIVRKCREIGFMAIVKDLNTCEELLLKGITPSSIIFSGGPSSAVSLESSALSIFKEVDKKKIPTLGICYGHQLMASYFGGEVLRAPKGEFGQTKISGDLFGQRDVWMSHHNYVEEVPESFEVLAKSENNFVAMMKSRLGPYLGIQFHPEVVHTERGDEYFNYFFKEFVEIKSDWDKDEMLSWASNELSNKAILKPQEKILCAFSGGVDSLVAAVLAGRILGNDKIDCYFIDNGLLRHHDLSHIQSLKEKLPFSIKIIMAQDFFLERLKKVDDPEEKRKIIGKTFIDVFEQEMVKSKEQNQISHKYLLQGTLYPDVIESIAAHTDSGEGPTATIKSHHNVGGLPKRMKLITLEPFRFLFKDEVRKIGELLGLERSWLYRHPFPGPGLGIRILGNLTEKRIAQVRDSDKILHEELDVFNLYDEIWQAFTALLPVYTVGVKGDARVYEQVIVLRLVDAQDGMTADWSDVPRDFLSKVSSRITSEVDGIARVVYDITSKPPGTIEWE